MLVDPVLVELQLQEYQRPPNDGEEKNEELGAHVLALGGRHEGTGKDHGGRVGGVEDHHRVGGHGHDASVGRRHRYPGHCRAGHGGHGGGRGHKGCHGRHGH